MFWVTFLGHFWVTFGSLFGSLFGVTFLDHIFGSLFGTVVLVGFLTAKGLLQALKTTNEILQL
jgi:hypothetical protein